MNKLLILPVALTLTTGCLTGGGSWGTPGERLSSETMTVQHTQYRTLGVAPGDESHMGMVGSTCGLDGGGNYTYDDDVAANQDELVVDTNGNGVLVVAGGTLVEHIPGGQSTDLGGSGVITATYVDGGVVTLSDTGAGCSVQWTQGLFGSAEVPSCDPADLSVDRSTGTVAVSDGEHLVFAVPGESWRVAAPGQARWDAAAARIVTVQGNTLSALTEAGELEWTTQLDAEATDLVVAGQGVIALTSRGLVHVDAAGTVVDSLALPGADGRLYASADGRHIALESDVTLVIAMRD